MRFLFHLFGSFKGASSGFRRHFLPVEIARDWWWSMNNAFAPFGMNAATRMIFATLKCGWNMYVLIMSSTLCFYNCRFICIFAVFFRYKILYLAFEMALQAENCVDAEVIFSFLDSNEIGQTHSIFFISYALHMESKNKIKTANDIFNRGISR